jgi:hypothetical protein
MKTVLHPAIGCDPVQQSLAACVQSQPGRVRAIFAGLCAESADEAFETYDASVVARILLLPIHRSAIPC